MSEQKATNPKDRAASNRLPLDIVPSTIQVFAALAFTEGAVKYTAYNWREAGVLASVYIAAAERHLALYKNGEWCDPKTGVPHLASVIACMGIIADANLLGKLTDDRGPANPQLCDLIRDSEADVVRIRALFAGLTPQKNGPDVEVVLPGAVDTVQTTTRVVGMCPELAAPYHGGGSSEPFDEAFKRVAQAEAFHDGTD